VNKSRREKRRIRQGKPPEHSKRFKGVYTKKRVIGELLVSIAVFLGGLFFTKDFFFRLSHGHKFWCEQRYDSSCISSEIVFGLLFMLAGALFFAHLVYMVKSERNE